MNQLASDRNLLKRIDEYGKGLTPGEVELVESFMKWVETKPLTEKQRKVAEQIEERRVR